jgi:response regulator NasT
LQKVVRVLVIAESVERADVVREGLLIGGHEAAEVVATDGPPLPAVIERSRPDAVVLQTRSPDVDLLDRTVDAMGTTAVPLIIFTEDSSERTISLAVRAGAAAYIVDGLQAARVPAILQVALVRFEVLAGLRTELSSAQQRLAERKFVERAKGLLMKARGLSEDEAYHTLRRMAMERNRRLGDVAKSVLEMADLLN